MTPVEQARRAWESRATAAGDDWSKLTVEWACQFGEALLAAAEERDALESKMAAQVASQAIAEREVIALQASVPPDGVAPESYAMGFRAGLECAAQECDKQADEYDTAARTAFQRETALQAESCQATCEYLADAIRGVEEKP